MRAMKLVKQGQSLSVNNFDFGENASDIPHRHGALLPDAVRAIICGPSGSGKTNIMLSLLFEPNGLKFANVYVYSKSLYQPKYTFLENVLRQVKEVGYFPYTDNDDIVDPAEAKEHSVFIFDDVACDKQDKIRAYFSMGRHKKVDSLYLCQTYARIPKHLVRDNANIIVLFKQDELNLRHCYDDHVTTDVSFDRFKDMCRTCWQDNYGVLVIVKDCDISKGRYRKGFDEFICV